MILLLATVTSAMFIYGGSPMAIVEPVKPSSQPVPPPGSSTVNCSAILLRKITNPAPAADASRVYPSWKLKSTLQENDRADNRVNDQLAAAERERLLNCSDPEISFQPIGEYNEWKNVVVMGCTLAVAMEILIVLFMVVFWQQIRWTLRKITCPCDLTRRQSRRHAAMRRRSDTGADGAVNQDTNLDDVTSLDSHSSLERTGGEAERWGTEMQIYEPTTSGAFNGSFVNRSEDIDDDNSSTDEERDVRENRCYDQSRKRNSIKDGYYVLERGHGSAYLDADCFAKSAYCEDEYEMSDGGETSRVLNDINCGNDANSFANNFRAEGDEWSGAASAARCLNKPDEYLNDGRRTGSKKGKESARSHRKGIPYPILSNASTEPVREMTLLKSEKKIDEFTSV